MPDDKLNEREENVWINLMGINNFVNFLKVTIISPFSQIMWPLGGVKKWVYINPQKYLI